MATICHLLFCAVIAAVFTNALSKTADYCNLESCLKNRATHTMCKYKSNLPASTCVNLKNRGLTNNEKYIIVKKHNELRQRVAAGNEKRGNPGPQPSAAHMPNLSWDNELETIAQRWADQCTFSHDQCRNVERFPVGQNIAITMSSGENNTPVEEMVQLWYDEVKDMDKRQVEKITRFTAGHYTQLVWGATIKIGCGRVKYQGQGWNNQLLVCNYGPAGNYFGQRVYEVKK